MHGVFKYRVSCGGVSGRGVVGGSSLQVVGVLKLARLVNAWGANQCGKETALHEEARLHPPPSSHGLPRPATRSLIRSGKLCRGQLPVARAAHHLANRLWLAACIVLDKSLCSGIPDVNEASVNISPPSLFCPPLHQSGQPRPLLSSNQQNDPALKNTASQLVSTHDNH